MVPSDLILRMPPGCPQCHALGSVTLQQTIRGTSVILAWACAKCDTEWPIERCEPQFVERRSARPDPRAPGAAERRKTRS